MTTVEIVFDQLIDRIAVYLPLKELANILTINRKYYYILGSDRFWKQKLENDYRLSKKRADQTWVTRYRLAASMGQIFIKDICNNAPMNCDMGRELDLGDISDKFNQTYMEKNRLLPYKAIAATLVRPYLYYIDDEYNLWVVGGFNSNKQIYKTPILLDTNVTKLGDDVLIFTI